MKLLLFIIGLTLCASWPAFRNLAVSHEENNEEHSFLEFTDVELGEYLNFGDSDHDNGMDLFDLNFNLNEEGDLHGEEEYVLDEPSDAPNEQENTQDSPDAPNEQENNEPSDEPNQEETEQPSNPEEPAGGPNEETPEEPAQEDPEVPEEAVEEPSQQEPEAPEEEIQEDSPSDTEEPQADLLTQVRADSEANGALDFGVSTIIKQGITDNKIPNENFAVSVISNYSKTSNKNGNLHKFSCVAVSANGASVVNMNFTVYYQLSNQRRTLSSYSYNIKTTNIPVSDYTQIGDAEISTALVQTVLNYGASQIYTIGTQTGKIPVSNFTITNIVSVWKQVTTLGTNYKCQVVLENSNKVTVNANFTVYYKTSTQQNSVIQYSYNVKNFNSNTNNTTTPTNNTNPTNPTNPTNTTNTTNPVDTNTNNTTTNPTTPVTNSTNNTNTNTTTDPYTALTQDEIQNSAEVQAALQYGGNQTIQQGYAKKKIPVSIYTITKVISVGKQATSGRNAYKCSVEINDPRGILVKAQYTIYVNVSTQEMSVNAWSYQIFNLRYADDPFPNTTNTTNTNNNNNNNGNNNNNNNTNNNNGNNNNTNTNTNANNNSTNNNNNTNTNTNTNTNSSNNNANNTSNYTALSQAEIANSAEVQGALNYGANQTLFYGYTKGKIPVSNYTIAKVNSVGKQAISNGRNSYKCDIELQDVNKVLVKAQFVVNVKASTQEMSLGVWAYQVSNGKKL